MEEDFYNAVKRNQKKKAEDLLRLWDLELRWENPQEERWTSLHLASALGSQEIVATLLRAGNIDVNKKSENGSTPLILASQLGKTEVVKVLLSDKRVDVNLVDKQGRSAFWWAARNGFYCTMKWILAAASVTVEVDPNMRAEMLAIHRAQPTRMGYLVDFLKFLQVNPAALVHKISLDLNLKDALAADLFATAVLHADGFFAVRDPAAPTPASRFLGVAQRLPLELQMLLCNRVAGLGKDFIPSRAIENAFKAVAGHLGGDWPRLKEHVE